MDLSIIIPSFNTKDLLDRCLSSIYSGLKDSSLTFEIIVLDNASTDGSQPLLKEKYPRVIKIFNKDNIGYGKANNIGIRKAKGKYVLLLNSDIKVQNGAVNTLFESVSAQAKIFAGGKLLNEDGSPQDSCGPTYTLPVVALMLFGKGDSLHITRYSPVTQKKVDWVSGACLMGSKDAFLDLGLFDENIFMYMEEIDLLYRAHLKGYTTIFVPDACFIHTGAASSGNKRRPVVNIYRGLLYFYRKHRSIIEQRLVWILLRSKAYSAIFLGRILGNRQLETIYAEALRLGFQ